MSIQNPDVSHRVVDDFFSSITPNCFVQGRVSSPSGPWKPARWLPVQFTKTDMGRVDYFVCSKGKPLSLDTEGRLVPSGFRGWLQNNSLVYSQTDVKAGVHDLTTGEPLTSTATYTSAQVRQALVERGLVLEGDVSDHTVTKQVIEYFISRPVGIAQDDVFVYAGRLEDGEKPTHHNYNKQHAINVLTDIQMKVPLLASDSTSSDSFDASTLNTAGTATFASGEFPSAGEYWEPSELTKLARYSGDHSDEVKTSTPVVALVLAQAPVAKKTDRTDFSSDVTGVLIRERDSIAKIKREGDWYLDDEVGLLFLHEDTWATLVADTATPTFTYNYYSTGGADAFQFVHMDGTPRPGDYVAYDDDSNLLAVSEPASWDSWLDCIGRVWEIIEEPVGLLDRVETAYSGDEFSASAAMPGSATKGFSDNITLNSGDVADRLVVVNCKLR